MLQLEVLDTDRILCAAFRCISAFRHISPSRNMLHISQWSQPAMVLETLVVDEETTDKRPLIAPS